MIRKQLLLMSLLGMALVTAFSVIPVKAASANGTGLTTKIVAITGQVITGTIDANGYDIGVYVGPAVTGVVITNAMIFGANDHGIYIQDTSGVVVKDSTITGNGVAPHSGLTEDKAIVLAGTTSVLVKSNNVSFNLADGGISVIDDGPINPAQPNPGTPHVSNGNAIIGNYVKDNLFGCGIVISGKNPGEGASDNIVKGNAIIGNSPGPNPPYIGGIVIAGYATTDNVVMNNVVEGGWIAGINLHSFGPGKLISGTAIINNTFDSNGPNVAPSPTGIEIAALFGGVITNTQVIRNTVTNDYYGVWHINDVHTNIVQLEGNAVVSVAP